MAAELRRLLRGQAQINYRALITLILAVLATSACTQQLPQVAESGPQATSAQEAQVQTELDGAALYQTHCANCHDQTFYKAPGRFLLSLLSPMRILDAMNDGLMQAQAASLEPMERQAVAEFVSGRRLAEFSSPPLPPACEADEAFDLGKPPVSNGWGVDERNTRFQPFANGGLSADNVAKLEVKWVFAYPNAYQARSEPVYGGGIVFVGSHDGKVWALGAESGCLLWTFQARAEVRTGIVISDWSADDSVAEPMIFFGDLLANVYALDAKSGKQVWQQRADDHSHATLTGTPTFHKELLYVPVSSLEVLAATDPQYACCTFQGAVLAIEARTGKLRWKSRTADGPPAAAGKTSADTDILAPSGAPVWSSPTIDAKRKRLYVATGENYSSPSDIHSDAIIAFDLNSGKKLWVSQQTQGDAWNAACFDGIPGMDTANCPVEKGPDYDFGSHTILYSLPNGEEVLVGGQKSGDIVGVNPDDGKTLWKTRIGSGGVQGGVHFGIAAGDQAIYAPINDMLVAGDDQRYEKYNKARQPAPGVHALDALSGKLLWSSAAVDTCGELADCTDGVSQAISAIPGAVIAGFLDGWLRIYARGDGRLLWENNTLGLHESVNGVKAKGGAFSGGGVLVAHGMLYANSGYGFNNHMPGNALIAFGLASEQ